MWGSWSLNPDYVKGRLDEAVMALADYVGTSMLDLDIANGVTYLSAQFDATMVIVTVYV